MHIVGQMTVDTAIADIAENRSQMTGFTTVRGMLANQWKTSQVMIKANLVLPGNLIVTLATFGTLVFLVNIVLLMAAVTGGIDVLGFITGKMAGRAHQFFVCAPQREVGLSVMIKGRDVPAFGGVTILALRAVSLVVDVVSAVAAIAVARVSAIF
jgi:hypothetical protein